MAEDSRMSIFSQPPIPKVGETEDQLELRSTSPHFPWSRGPLAKYYIYTTRLSIFIFSNGYELMNTVYIVTQLL